MNTYGYVDGNPLIGIDPLGLATWRCKRPLGDKPGEKGGIFFNHTYACVTDKSGSIVCSSTAGDGSSSDYLYSDGAATTSETDYYNEKSCKPYEDDGNNCVEQCMLNKWAEKRPSYGIGPQGTDCQEYTDDSLNSCSRACWSKQKNEK